jgi:hypothetical protein
VVEDQYVELLDDLLAPIPRKAILPAVEAALGVSRKQADAIVQAFDDYVARPLEANLKKLRGRDLARRNPAAGEQAARLDEHRHPRRSGQDARARF